MFRTQSSSRSRIPLRCLVLGALSATSFFASSARAQETIATDRPGLLTSPWLVQPGHLQLEFGLPSVALAREGGTHVDGYSAPLLVRYGLSQGAELRLAATPWNHVRTQSGGSTDTTTGFGDVEVGAKFALSEPSESNAAIPRSALVLGVRLPVGDDDFTSHQTGYSLTFAASWDVPGGNALTALAGASRVPVSDDNSMTGTFGLALGRALDEKWSGYVEAVFFPGFHAADAQAYAGLGTTWLLSKDVQFDASVDFGLNDTSTDALFGLGISWRH